MSNKSPDIGSHFTRKAIFNRKERPLRADVEEGKGGVRDNGDQFQGFGGTQRLAGVTTRGG